MSARSNESGSAPPPDAPLRIVHVVRNLGEHQGGPSVSVPRLALATAGLGHPATVLATGAALPPRLPAGLDARVFPGTGPEVLGASVGLASALRRLQPDVVHSHGLWRRTLHYGARQARRGSAIHVVSPRGMMAPWAWAHHRRRKTAARWLLHPGALESADGWHATSALEAEEIRALGFTQPICVAPNGVDEPDTTEAQAAASYWRSACPATGHRRTAVFYSRFHAKKRLVELIDLWLVVAPADWLLLLVGLPETYSVADLESYIGRHPARDRIVIFDGTGRPPPYAVAQLFLLPSHSENFGLVIADALAHGVPVLVTDTTPWPEVVAAHAGWCVPWSDYESTLRRVLALSPEALAAHGVAAKAWVIPRFSWGHSATLLVDFYRQLRSAP